MWLKFNGFRPGSKFERDDAAGIAGLPQWPKGEVREVTDDVGAFLLCGNSADYDLFSKAGKPSAKELAKSSMTDATPSDTSNQTEDGPPLAAAAKPPTNSKSKK